VEKYSILSRLNAVRNLALKDTIFKADETSTKILSKSQKKLYVMCEGFKAPSTPFSFRRWILGGGVGVH